MAGVKLVFLGSLFGTLLTLSICGYLYFTKAQPSDSMKWAIAHPEEVDWARARYEKFQQAAKELYMKQDDIMQDKSN